MSDKENGTKLDIVVMGVEALGQSAKIGNFVVERIERKPDFTGYAILSYYCRDKQRESVQPMSYRCASLALLKKKILEMKADASAHYSYPVHVSIEFPIDKIEFNVTEEIESERPRVRVYHFAYRPLSREQQDQIREMLAC